MVTARLLMAMTCGLVLVAAVGCAKRPAIREVAAPAPTGVSAPVAPPPRGPAPAPPPVTTAPAPPAEAAPTPPPVAAPPAAPPPAVTPPAAAPPPPPAAPPPPAPVTAARPAEAVTPPPARPEEFGPRPELEDVYFDFDRADIRPDAAAVLDASAAWLRENAGYLVLIEGHCDERGTNAYNLALGERRARAAMTYLISRGVAAGRFTTVSYGEERPVCTERAETCWSRNRRAHFLVKPR